MPVQVSSVIQLRVAITTNQFEQMLKFYLDGLGLEPAELWNQNGGQGALISMGRATLEVFSEEFATGVDEVETGRRTSGPIRLAIQVPDLQIALDRLVSRGAVLVHPPVVTPWGDINARLQDPDGLQVTLFQSPARPGET